MAFQLRTERFLDGIANYLIIFGLCLRISKTTSHCNFAAKASTMLIVSKRAVGEKVSS